MGLLSPHTLSALRRCATNLTALPLTPPRRYPSQRRFGDALLPHQPDRALLTSSPIAVVTESDRASGLAFS